MSSAMYFNGDDLDGYAIHIQNPNSAPNTPNAKWSNATGEVKITYFLDPATVGPDGVITRVELQQNQAFHFIGDLKGYTFSSTNSSGGCGGTHNPNTNEGHFTNRPGPYHGGRPSTNDSVVGSTLNDTMDGRTGNDSLWGNYGDDFLVGGTGNDYLDGGEDQDTLIGGDGKDTLFGQTGNDLLDGGIGDDYLDGGAGDDIFIGAAGVDTMFGGAGFDMINYSNSTGNMTITLSETLQDGQYVGYGSGGDAEGDAFAGMESIVTGSGNDSIVGNSQNNTMFGLAGNDSLIGSTGSDSMYGGAGADVYLWNANDNFDFFVESTADAGVDTLVIRGTTDLFVVKDGNNLALGTGNEDWTIIYDWYLDPGLEYVVIGSQRYSTTDLAAMATSLAEGSSLAADARGMLTKGAEVDVLEGIESIDFNEISLSGVQLAQPEMIIA